MAALSIMALPMFSPGLPELLVIAGVVVLVFGAGKLPKLGKGLGEGIKNFKEGLKGDSNKENSSKQLKDKDSSDN
jgi:sec-independent protein translocase protein TatA